MKVLLYGRTAKSVESLVKNLAFQIVQSNPDAVISYGGDGTLLSAERQYPNIPKLPMRNNQICKKCSDHEDEIMLKKLLEGKLKIKKYKKLETIILYKSFLALNDFVIRNSDPTHTIRFKVTVPLSSLHKSFDPEVLRTGGRESINNEQVLSFGNKLLIGDGVVISTPFGSTGYFKSITGQSFNKGFGLAFNNTTEKVPPVFLGEGDLVIFNLVRGKATLSFDNNPDIFTIDEGSELVFKLSNQLAKIYEPESLRCPNCEVIRG